MYCIIQTSTVSRSQPVSHLSVDIVVSNVPHSHNYKLTNESSLSSCQASLPNYRLQIDRLQVLLQSCLIMAYNCIAKLTRSMHSSASPSSLDYGLQAHMITASKCISKLATSWRPSASAKSLKHSPQVYLQTGSITACNFLSKPT